MARRGGRIWRCRADGKTAFSGWRLAQAAMNQREEPGHIYWCRRGGGYHMTRYSPAEYERRRAAAAHGLAVA